MKLKLYCAIAVFAAISCNKPSENAEAIKQLKLRKGEIDSLITEKSLKVWTKVEGKEELLPVVGGKYPQNIETTYNVLKDKDGHILYIAELPFSKTSDWFIAYRSYYDANGELFAFQKLNNFLHSQCTRGAAIEKTTSYFVPSSAVPIDSAYSLTDSQNKPLDKATCKFPYNFSFKIIATVDTYIAERGIH